jgi:uncharacterized protein YndB with AHSA1/START domain
MTTNGLGTLVRDGDRCTLTFTRRLAHAPDKVWRALTEPEHLAAWFPDSIVGEMRAGAPLRFVGDEGEFTGEMVVFEPPSVLEFLWGTDRLRIEVRADPVGTVLTLTDTFAEIGKAARDGAGWHECLDRLEHDLDGTALPAWGESWRELNARYVEALGPEASTIGPPEGWGSDSAST